MPTRYIGKYDESELKAFPTADLRSLLRGAAVAQTYLL
jgi:hypothetical protein